MNENGCDNPYVENNEGADATVYDNRPNTLELIATSHSIRLTCCLAALSSVFALFLFFADLQSRAVRRTSIQSATLGAVFVMLSIIIFFLNILFAFIPIIRMILGLVLTIIHIVVGAAFVVMKVRLMLHAYRGYAYIVPGIGEYVRKFE